MSDNTPAMNENVALSLLSDLPVLREGMAIRRR